MNDTHENSTLKSCSSLPEFIMPFSSHETCIAIPPRALFIKQITATSGCSNVSMQDVNIFAPLDTSKGELQHIRGTNYYYINFVWIPTANQQNDTYFLCFIAVNSVGLNSVPFCMQLAVGYHPPAPLPEFANHQLVYPSNNTLHIMFDRIVKRPPISAFIRFYNLGQDLEVYQIDASLSNEVTFDGSSITIVPNYTFVEGNTYYINFDGGVVQSVDSVAKGCQLVNEPILGKTFWTYNVIDLTPGKRLINICNFYKGNIRLHLYLCVLII